MTGKDQLTSMDEAMFSDVKKAAKKADEDAAVNTPQGQLPDKPVDADAIARAIARLGGKPPEEPRP